MATPKKTLWPIEPHTLAKHAILEGYLQAWFAILGQKRTDMLYVDGFCGPGRYQGGEPGSPIVALEAAKNNLNNIGNSKVHFWFIDESPDRIAHLKEELYSATIPSNFVIEVHAGEFESVFSKKLQELERRAIPSFVFIDPFGFKGFPYTMVSRILAVQSAEVFINLMIDAINRFIEHPTPSIRDQIRTTIGLENLADIEACPGSRFDSLRLHYQEQLKSKAKFVRYFEMRDVDDRSIYDLFFASNSRLGHVKMKESMWNVDREGRFRFSDAEDPSQIFLFDNEDSWRPILEKEIIRTFSSFSSTVVRDIRCHIENHTAFLATHMRQALKSLESIGEIRVEELNEDQSKRRAGAFNDPVVISFKNVQRNLL